MPTVPHYTARRLPAASITTPRRGRGPGVALQPQNPAPVVNRNVYPVRNPVAEAVSAAGDNLSAAFIWQANKQQEERDALAALDLTSVAAERDREFRRQIQKRKGAAAKNVYEETKSFWKDLEEELSEKVENDRQYRLFRRKFEALKSSALDSAARYQALQHQVWQEGTWEGLKQQAVSAVAEEPSFTNVAKQLKILRDDVDAAFPSGVRDPENPAVPSANDARIKEIERTLYLAALKSSVAKVPGQVDTQIKWLKATKPGLVPDEALEKIRKLAHSEADRILAVNTYATAFAEHPDDPEAARKFIERMVSEKLPKKTDRQRARWQSVRDQAWSDYNTARTNARTLAKQKEKDIEDAEIKRMFDLMREDKLTPGIIRSSRILDPAKQRALIEVLKYDPVETDPVKYGDYLGRIYADDPETVPTDEEILKDPALTRANKQTLILTKARKRIAERTAEKAGIEAERKSIDNRWLTKAMSLYSLIAKDKAYEEQRRGLTKDNVLRLQGEFYDYLVNTEEGRALHGQAIYDEARRWLAEYLPAWDPPGWGDEEDYPTVYNWQMKTKDVDIEAARIRERINEQVEAIPWDIKRRIVRILSKNRKKVDNAGIWNFYKRNEARLLEEAAGRVERPGEEQE